MHEIGWQEAERIIGHTLDRRRKYATTDDGKPAADMFGAVLFVVAAFTASCSGCTETSDGYNVNGFPTDPKHGCLVGAGCRECGYTGKSRQSYWVPYLRPQQAAA